MKQEQEAYQRGDRGWLAAAVFLLLITLSLLPFQVSMMRRGGVPAAAAYTAVVLAVAAGTFLLGWQGKLPLAIGPSLTINTFVIYSVVISSGMSWSDAMGSVLLAALFSLLSFLRGWHRQVLAVVPASLQAAIKAGLGMLLIVTALEQGHLIVPSTIAATALGDFADPVAFLSLGGVAVTMGLWLNGNRLAAVAGVLAIFLGACGLGLPDWPRYPLTMPAFPVQAGMLSWSNPLESFGLALLLALFCSLEAGIILQGQSCLAEEQPSDNIHGCKLAAVATGLGAILGAGVVNVLPQSLGVRTAGGYDGRSAILAAGLMLPMVFASPLAEMLEQCGYFSVPVLVLAGMLLMKELSAINWQDGVEAFAAMLVLVFMPLGNMLSGAGLGLAGYCLLKVLRDGIQSVPRMLYGITLIFVLQLVFFPI